MKWLKVCPASLIDKAVVWKMLSVSVYGLVLATVYTQTCCEQKGFLFPTLCKHASTQIGLLIAWQGPLQLFIRSGKYCCQGNWLPTLAPSPLYCRPQHTADRLCVSVVENFLFLPSFDWRVVAAPLSRWYAFFLGQLDRSWRHCHVKAWGFGCIIASISHPQPKLSTTKNTTKWVQNCHRMREPACTTSGNSLQQEIIS